MRPHEFGIQLLEVSGMALVTWLVAVLLTGRELWAAAGGVLLAGGVGLFIVMLGMIAGFWEAHPGYTTLGLVLMQVAMMILLVTSVMQTRLGRALLMADDDDDDGPEEDDPDPEPPWWPQFEQDLHEHLRSRSRPTARPTVRV